MYTLRTTSRFDSDLKRCKREGLDLRLMQETLDLLVAEGRLPESYATHQLVDEYAGCWECHIDDDWLLVWQQDDNRLTLLMTSTGTHDYLFKNH